MKIRRHLRRGARNKRCSVVDRIAREAAHTETAAGPATSMRAGARAARNSVVGEAVAARCYPPVPAVMVRRSVVSSPSARRLVFAPRISAP